MTLSAIVLTHNNQDTIQACLRSLGFVNEIVVIDDYSTDRTLDLIEPLRLSQTFDITYSQPQPPIQVYQQSLAGDFSGLRNWGLDKAKGEWVLFVDADEIVSPELGRELSSAIQKTTANGFYIRRFEEWNGQRLKFGEPRGLRFIRLAKRKSGRWQEPVHEIWGIPDPVVELNYPLIHRRTLSVTDFITRINRYTTIQAREWYLKQKKESMSRVLLNPLGKFISNYFFKLGMLDGWLGFCLAWLMSWHSFLVRVKLRLLWLNRGKEYFRINQD